MLSEIEYAQPYCIASTIERRADPRPSTQGQKKSGRPQLGRPSLAKSSGEEGKTCAYKDRAYNDGFALGVGVVLGACAGVAPSPVLVIRRISTRRFLARPSRVLLLSTGLSLPNPIR